MCGVAGACFLLGGCGMGSDPSGTASGSAEPSVTQTQSPLDEDAAGEATEVAAKVIDTDFRPVTLTIGQGSTVNWKQIGDQPHSVTAADGSFDSSPECGPVESDRCLSQGDTFSHVFEDVGEFIYYCRVHGLPDGTGMVGTIVVE